MLVDIGNPQFPPTIKNKEFNTANVYVTRHPNSDGQNKTNWCWAAASKKVGEHNGGSGALNTGSAVLVNTVGLHTYSNEKFFGANPNGSITVDAGQRQIVVAVHGSDANNTGGNDAKEVALELSARNDVTVKTLGLGRLGLSALNKSTMNNDLSDGRWIVGNVFTDDSDWSGHSIVIQSYNSSTQVYTYWDPWTNTIGTFTKTQLNNDTIHLTTSTTDRVLAWIQRCY